MTKPIAAAWQKLMVDCKLQNAPAVQKREMRRAFYAGAAVMLSLVESLGDEGTDEDAAVASLKDLAKECADFLSQVGREY
jgi:hypothetical protein